METLIPIDDSQWQTRTHHDSTALVYTTCTKAWPPAPPPGEERLLYRTVLPPQFEEVAAPCGVTGTVVVQASAELADNQWVLDLAARHPSIVGLCGYVDPNRPHFAAEIRHAPLRAAPRRAAALHGSPPCMQCGRCTWASAFYPAAVMTIAAGVYQYGSAGSAVSFTARATCAPASGVHEREIHRFSPDFGPISVF
jgi:hypothetical protein